MTMTETQTKTETSFCSSTRALALATARDAASKVPDAAHIVTSGTLNAYRMVDTIPSSQRKQLTAISVAAGALLLLFGAPRLLALLAFIPALAVAGRKLAHEAAADR